MKRREALKSIGLLGLAGLGGGLLSACENDTTRETADNTPATSENAQVQSLSERDQKIINRQQMEISDPANPSELELKHSPEITLGEKGPKGFTQVNISVGQQGIIHPVEDNHWIDFISLYADEKKVGHIEFEAGLSRGFASFYAALEGVGQLRAEAGCNLHGIWQSTIEV